MSLRREYKGFGEIFIATIAENSVAITVHVVVFFYLEVTLRGLKKLQFDFCEDCGELYKPLPLEMKKWFKAVKNLCG